MRLSISNIAWDVSEDEEVAKLLKLHEVDAIDIAPSKYFPDVARVADVDVALVKKWWAVRGFKIIGMQALLFGTVGLNLFGDKETQDRLLKHLESVCRIGAGLGATKLVFGSPKNRDRTGLTDDEVMNVAISFFRRLGDIAEHYGVFVCLEPNPACYGSNFMTDSYETADVVTKVAHSAIKMQLDTGAMSINKEDAWELLENHASLIGHIHLSEPNLLPLGDGDTKHSYIATCLNSILPNYDVCIEMLATQGESHLVSIERSLKVAASYQLDLKNEVLL